MTLPNYDLSTRDMLDMVEYRISMLTNFIAMNKSVRDNLLEQGEDMTNLDEYLAFMASLDRMMQALQEKRNSLENQG
jgi:hypothetical protein